MSDPSMQGLRPAVSVETCLSRFRSELVEMAPTFRKYWETVGDPGSLHLSDYFALYALGLSFRPDLILELGRSYGNSTCLFNELAHRTGARVVSYCLTDLWSERTLPRLQAIVPGDWTIRLDARTEDLARTDFASVVEGSRRVFVYWDVHGAALAESLIARLFSLFGARQALVTVDDAYDVRYLPPGSDGPRDPYTGERRYVLGRFGSGFDELLPLFDFVSRNQFSLYSGRHEMEPVGVQETLRTITGLPDPLQDLHGRPPGTFMYFEIDRPPLVPMPTRPRSLFDEIDALRPERIVAFGAGSVGKQFLWDSARLGKRIEAVLDSQPSKWGGSLEGVPILPPPRLADFSPATTVLVITSAYYSAILTEVRNMGWPIDRIVIGGNSRVCPTCLERRPT